MLQFSEWLSKELAFGISIWQLTACAAAVLLAFVWCIMFMPFYKYDNRADNDEKK